MTANREENVISIESARTTAMPNAAEIHPIVTAIIRGGPVRARCSSCQATITFGDTISAPLEQERKLRDAFLAHLRERHEDVLESASATYVESSNKQN